jgi:chaperonin GroES
MKVGPLGDLVLVKRIEEEEKTKGAIIILDTAKEKPQEGRHGRGWRKDAGRRQGRAAGNKDWGQGAVQQILRQRHHDGEEHLIVREGDILGVVEG